MNYCLIDKGVIKKGPKPLPTNWKNISNLPSLSATDLLKLNWLPTEYPELVFDSATQKRLADTYDIQADKVVVIFNIVNKTQEEIDAEIAEAAKPVVLEDNESISYIRAFLKAKFKNDILFPDKLKN